MGKIYDPLANVPVVETAGTVEGEMAAPQPGYQLAYAALEGKERFPLHFDPRTRTAIPVPKVYPNV